MAEKYLATFGVIVALGLAVSATNQESRESKADFYGWVFATSQSDVVHAGQHFREDVFGKEPLYVSRDFNRNYFESTLSVDKIWPQLSTKTSDASSLAEKGNVIDIRVGGTKATATPEMRAVLSNPVDSHKSIPTKHSFIIRFEELEDRGEALDELRRRMSSESVGSEMGSVHGYYSGPGGTKALMPHTDPYDVVVLQIAGSKQWTTCVPSTPSNVTSAMRAKAYAKEHTNGQSCVTHDTASLNSMVCNHFVMRAGDALYLPRDIVHYAETTDEASVHLTIGLGGDDAECDTQDAMDSFTADVVQRSRRYCSTSTYSSAYSCDDSCDSYCDSSCDYYSDYESCDSLCDSSCDSSCDSGCYSSSSYYDDDDYSYSSYDDGFPWWIIGVIPACIIVCCVLCCFFFHRQNNEHGLGPPAFAGPPPPVYNGGYSPGNQGMVGTAIVGTAAATGILAHQMNNNSNNAHDGGGFTSNDLPPPSYVSANSDAAWGLDK